MRQVNSAIGSTTQRQHDWKTPQVQTFENQKLLNAYRHPKLFTNVYIKGDI